MSLANEETGAHPVRVASHELLLSRNKGNCSSARQRSRDHLSPPTWHHSPNPRNQLEPQSTTLSLSDGQSVSDDQTAATATSVSDAPRSKLRTAAESLFPSPRKRRRTRAVDRCQHSILDRSLKRNSKSEACSLAVSTPRLPSSPRCAIAEAPPHE